MKLCPAKRGRLAAIGPIAAAALLGTVGVGLASAQAQKGLVIVGSSREMIWNGVVVSGGRIYVSGPRWAGGHAPALAILNGNAVSPFPDAAWNAWKPGADAGSAFVNVNAIRLKDGFLWAVDTGSPEFGGDPLPNGAKVVKIDLATGSVSRVYSLAAAVAKHSYVDDIRIKGDEAYLTDAGETPAIIVMDLKSGSTRRVLESLPVVTATPGRAILLEGRPVLSPDGSPLKVNADPLELSPDGRYLYFGPLSGPWSRIETRLLDDPAVSSAELASNVQPWADLPPVGGTAMGKDGSLYFTELSTNALKRRSPDGQVSTIVTDKRLHWVDAPFIDDQGNIWLPVPQLDRAPPFNAGVSKIERPVMLFRYRLPAGDPPQR